MHSLCLAALVIAGAPCVAAADPRPNPRSLSNAALIAELPEAGNELTWDEATKNYVESPLAIEMRRRAVEGELSDSDWKSALVRTHALYSRTSWPKGRPYAIGMVAPTWLGSASEIRVTARLDNAKEARTLGTVDGCGVYNDYEREQRRYLEVGELRAEQSEVILDVSVDASTRLTDQLGFLKRAWSGSITLPVKQVPSLAEASEGVADPKTDAIISKAVIAQVGMSQGSPPTMRMWVGFEPKRAGEAVRADLTVPLTIEVLDGDSVVSRVGPFECAWDPTSPCMYMAVAEEFDKLNLKDQAMLDRLQLRVKPDPERAFQDLRRTQWWNGVVMVKLRDVLR